MKILVIGSIVLDEINSAGKTINKPGGIYYSLKALSCLSSRDDEIFICSNVDEISEQAISEIDKIDLKFIKRVQSVPIVHLDVFEDKEREEVFSHLNDPVSIPFEELKNFDCLLINMISGFDITLNQLVEIRKNFHGIIYFDVHSLARGIDKNYRRKFRQIKNFNLWARQVDIVQCNENEKKYLFDYSDERTLAKTVLNCGIKLFIITKAEFGVKHYFYDKEELNFEYISARKVNSTNNVGCGDVFGAAFLYNYMVNKNKFLALNFANYAAGLITTSSDLNKLKEIKNDFLK